MLLDYKPTGEVSNPIQMIDVITNKTEDIYIFENTTNRPFRWSEHVIKNDFFNELIECFNLNLDKNWETKFMILGNSCVSEPEDSSSERFSTHTENGKEIRRHIKSIIDGAHRIKLCFCSFIAMTILKNQEEGIDFFNTKLIYNRYGEPKLQYVGKKDFEVLYNFLRTENVNTIISKALKRRRSIFNSDQTEKNIVDVLLLCIDYLYHIKNENDVLKETTYDDMIKILLENVFLLEGRVDKEHKWDYFDSYNMKGVPPTKRDFIPRAIVEDFSGKQKEVILDMFESFERYADECDNEAFKPDMKHNKCCEWVMDIVLKIWLSKNVKGYTMDKKSENILEDINYGIKSAITNYGFCKSFDDASEYFKECYELCDFIKHSMEDNDDIYNTYFMFINENRGWSSLWWYCITPLYLMNKMCKTKEDRIFIYEYIAKCKMYNISSKRALNTTNIQNYINYMLHLSHLMVTDDNFVETIRKEKENHFFISCERAKVGRSLREYHYDINKNEIKHVLQWSEFIFTVKHNTEHSALYRLMTKSAKKSNGTDIDHIIPKLKYNDILNPGIDDIDSSPLGNLVLLESNTNRSKQDDMSVNAQCYCESSFYTTTLLCKDTRKGLTNDQLNSISFKRYSNEELENFNVNDAKERTSFIVDNYLDWLYS